MKVPPKYLAYGSVLAIGAVALAIDSAMPPASAAAAIEPQPAETTAAALASAAAAYNAPLDTGLAPLAERLAQLNQRTAGSQSPSRDVFAISPDAWGLDEAPPMPAPEALSNPSDSLHVSAILVRGGEGCAVINGSLVRVGSMLAGGYRVQQIRQRSVVLDLDGRTLVLEWRPPEVLGPQANP